MPCHAILVDHESKSLVLAIRGTASVTDGLVHDLVCNVSVWRLRYDTEITFLDNNILRSVTG